GNIVCSDASNVWLYASIRYAFAPSEMLSGKLKGSASSITSIASASNASEKPALIAMCIGSNCDITCISLCSIAITGSAVSSSSTVMVGFKACITTEYAEQAYTTTAVTIAIVVITR